jgi:hypothetical protein
MIFRQLGIDLIWIMTHFLQKKFIIQSFFNLTQEAFNKIQLI